MQNYTRKNQNILTRKEKENSWKKEKGKT